MFEWIISSSFLILAVVILRCFLKGRASSRLIYALWLLVLARLLIPFSIGSSSLSILNIIPTSEKEQQSISEQPITNVSAAMLKDAAEDDIVVNHQDAAAEIKSQSHISLHIFIWMLGTAAVGIVFIFSNFKLKKGLISDRRSIHYKNARLSVYLTNKTETPCLFGFFRPAIYVTEEVFENKTALYHSVEHEITHYLHKDHIWSALRLLCLAIHWYNPLVWCAAFLSQKDSELACDEGTIKRLGEQERASYGRTLINISSGKKQVIFSVATTMSDNKKNLKERIALIAKEPRTAAVTLAVILTFSLAAAGCTFTGKGEDMDISASSNKPDAGIEDLMTVFKKGQNEPFDKSDIDDAVNDFRLWCRDNLNKYDERELARKILVLANEEKLDKSAASKLTDIIYEKVSREELAKADYGTVILSELKMLLYKAGDVYWGDFLLSMEKEGLDYEKIHSLEQMGMTREEIVKLTKSEIEKRLGLTDDSSLYKINFSTNPVGDTELIIKNTSQYPFLGNKNDIHIQCIKTEYNSKNKAYSEKKHPIIYLQLKAYNEDGSVFLEFGIIYNTDKSVLSEDRYAVKYGNKGSHVTDYGMTEKEFEGFIDDMLFLIDEYNASGNEAAIFNIPLNSLNIEYVKKGEGIIINAENEAHIYPSMPGIVTEYKAIDKKRGSYMILYHGKGFETVYGFMNDEHMGKNMYVFPSEHIGTVKSQSNDSTGKLYFEIRKDGRALDAEKLLKLK